MTDTWNAKTYSQFLDSRTRPARDLLSAIPDSFTPAIVYDLGCGPGNSTALLHQRWSEAEIIGFDSSENMLEEARAAHPHLTFKLGDIAHFSPSKKADCLFANASLQWVADHETLLPTLLQQLRPGGILAIQMPNNFHAPSHQVTIKILQDHPHWRPLLEKLIYREQTTPTYQLPCYYDLLTSLGTDNLQLWETTYYQEMKGYSEIYDWVSGTGLRPILTAMNAENQAQFKEAYLHAIANEYPLQKNGSVLLPFRRVFIISTKT